ncbi:ABC transporter ATP-binding protein/permease [Thaumasiovibrio subtropicus]|uniref:ABC transporter ATP-binding protein/permease n=1 Tax=Thaumasiovibrio subtropicus TaxID=1891207 RepID=UPI000B363797|nr:ABC transporter ATP-binding protein/permease [Thaumasiovibrio subtropicus]
MSSTITLVALQAGKRRRLITYLVALGLVLTALNVGGVLLIQHLWQGHDASENLPLSIALFVVLVAVMGSLYYAEAVLAEKLGLDYVKAVRQQLYATLMSAPQQQSPQRVGVAMTRLITDANNIKNWASLGAPVFITHGLSLVGYCILILVQWPHVGWLLLALMAFALMATALLTAPMMRTALTLRRDRGRLSGHIGEMIIANLSVQQAGRVNREAKRLGRHSDLLADSAVNYARLRSLLAVNPMLLQQLALLVLAVSALGDGDHQAMLLLVLGLMFVSLTRIMQAWEHGVTYYAAKQRLEFAMRKVQPIPAEKSTKLTNQPLSIKLRDLALIPDSPLLKLSAAAGDRIILSGLQCSGKSLLTLMLCRQALPASGRIVLGGRRLEWLTAASLHRAVQLVNDDAQLMRGSIESNLLYGNRHIDTAWFERICQVLELEDLNQTVTELGSNLSSGLTQRILIARALLKKPGLLMVDRAGVDRDNPLQQAMLTLQKEGGFTYLLTTRRKLNSKLKAQWDTVWEI